MQRGDQANTDKEPDATRRRAAAPVCSRFGGGWYVGVLLVLLVSYSITSSAAVKAEQPRGSGVDDKLELAHLHDLAVPLVSRP